MSLGCLSGGYPYVPVLRPVDLSRLIGFFKLQKNLVESIERKLIGEITQAFVGAQVGTFENKFLGLRIANFDMKGDRYQEPLACLKIAKEKPQIHLLSLGDEHKAYDILSLYYFLRLTMRPD